MPSITIFEKVSLLIRIVGLFPYLLFTAVRTRSTRATKIAANRYLNSVQTIRHIQYLLPPTVSAYRSWVLQNSRPVNIEEIAARSENEADTKLLWLGEWQEGGKVLLFLHGGGYVMPLIKQYLDLLTWATEEPVAVLEYTNSPHERYPHQLKQAATSFAHLLERGVKPENIVIAGDSAGGHLALGLISHILHPNPSVRAIPALGAPLAGLVLISPAASFTANAASFERNGNKDILTRGTCDYWSQQLHSEGPYWSELAKGGYWGEAVEAPASWWKGVGDVVGRCLITAGSEEVILDDILRFAETMVALKEEKWEVERVLGAGEIHDAPLMDFVHEGKAVGETTQRVKTFMAECWGAGIRE